MRWTEIVARVGISSLLLPALLISSLLSFPSSCRCGAELPHVHGLFSLAGHSHNGTDAAAGSIGDPGHPHADDPTHQHGDVVTEVAPLTVELDPAAAAPLVVDTILPTMPAMFVADPLDVAGHPPRTTPDAVDGPDASVQVQAPGSAPIAPGVGLPVQVTTESSSAHASEVAVTADQTLAGRETLPDTPPPQDIHLA